MRTAGAFYRKHEFSPISHELSKINCIFATVINLLMNKVMKKDLNIIMAPRIGLMWDDKTKEQFKEWKRRFFEKNIQTA